MMAHRVLTWKGLLGLIRPFVADYCRQNGLPQLGVYPDDGTMDPESLAAFNFKRVKMFVSERLLRILPQHAPRQRLWAVFSAIRHELRHYEQFLYLRQRQAEVTKGMLNEDEAYVLGRTWADRNIGELSDEAINPGHSRRRNPRNLYQDFHGVLPKRARRVSYEPPKSPLIKIGRLTELKYRPEGSSEHVGTEFYHVAGDIGTQVLRSNLILATDAEGRNLYLLRDRKGSKYPVFTGRGILG